MCRFNLMITSRESVAGSVIQATGTVEFEDGLWISGLPKAEGLRSKAKVSHLRLRLRLPKVYMAEGRSFLKVGISLSY